MMIGIPANPFFLNTTPKPSVNENSKFPRFGTGEKKVYGPMVHASLPSLITALLCSQEDSPCLEIESNNQDSCMFPMHCRLGKSKD